MTAGQDPAKLKRQVHLHALPVGWEQLDYATFLDRRRSLMAQVVQEGFATLWGDRRPQSPASIDDLIAAGESETIEFKSTARVNLHTGEADPKTEHVIVKTVCGLLNHEGGTLLIGVADDGQILGIEPDLRTFGAKGNTDGYELHLRQLLDPPCPPSPLRQSASDSTPGRDASSAPSQSPLPPNQSSPRRRRASPLPDPSSGSASGTQPSNSTAKT